MKTFFTIGFALSLVFLNGCVAIKKHPKKEVVEGSYEVIRQEKYEVGGENALVVGSVYDKRTGTPLGYTSIHIKEIEKGVLADTLGRFSFEVPSGIYKIEVSMVGNSVLITEPIKLESDTRTEIRFNLGTVVEY